MILGAFGVFTLGGNSHTSTFGAIFCADSTVSFMALIVSGILVSESPTWLPPTTRVTFLYPWFISASFFRALVMSSGFPPLRAITFVFMYSFSSRSLTSELPATRVLSFSLCSWPSRCSLKERSVARDWLRSSNSSLAALSFSWVVLSSFVRLRTWFVRSFSVLFSLISSSSAVWNLACRSAHSHSSDGLLRLLVESSIFWASRFNAHATCSSSSHVTWFWLVYAFLCSGCVRFSAISVLCSQVSSDLVKVMVNESSLSELLSESLSTGSTVSVFWFTKLVRFGTSSDIWLVKDGWYGMLDGTFGAVKRLLDDVFGVGKGLLTGEFIDCEKSWGLHGIWDSPSSSCLGVHGTYVSPRHLRGLP